MFSHSNCLQEKLEFIIIACRRSMYDGETPTCNPQKGVIAAANGGTGSKCLLEDFRLGCAHFQHVSPILFYQLLFPLSGKKLVLSKLSDTCQPLLCPTTYLRYLVLEASQLISSVNKSRKAKINPNFTLELY